MPTRDPFYNDTSLAKKAIFDIVMKRFYCTASSQFTAKTTTTAIKAKDELFTKTRS